MDFQEAVKSSSTLSFFLNTATILFANFHAFCVNISFGMTTLVRASQSALLALETEFLATLLKEMGICSTIEEAEAIAEVITGDCDGDDGTVALANPNCIQERLFENADIDSIQTEEVIAKLQERARGGVVNGGDSSTNGIDKVHDDEDMRSTITPQSTLETNGDDDSDEDDGAILDDGECELCDRFIRLTRHHLIPRSTWPRLRQRLLFAADCKERGDVEKARTILGPGLLDRLERVSSDKATIRELLHEACDICRPCHTAVHRAHSNIDLASYLNTVPKLLEDEKISKFCKWASKQKTGRYKVW
jgi:hypothetical protein